jgi:hypothetical protein
MKKKFSHRDRKDHEGFPKAGNGSRFNPNP